MDYEPADIANPKSYAHPEKFDELFTRLRKENSIPWVDSKIYRPFWIISKYSDMLDIFKKPQIFNSAPQPHIQPKEWEEQRIKKYGRHIYIQALVSMDPPEHTAYRKILQEWFKPANLLKHKISIAEIAKYYIDEMASCNGECDFVTTVSQNYPLRVIMKVLGLPQEDEEMLLKLTRSHLTPTDQPNFQTEKDIDIQVQAQQKIFEYLKEIVQKKKECSDDDLTTLVIRATVNEKPIPELEQLSILLSLATAGHETSAATIAGSLLVFAQNPKILQQLKNDLSLIPSAVEEMFRWISPAKTGIRNVAVDYEIRGQKIKAGERVAFFLPSANRDDEIFEDPFTIRLDRKPNPHLAFGAGIHACLGMHLARLEIASIFEELIPRLESVELNGEYSYSEALQVSGLKKLPLKYKMK